MWRAAALAAGALRWPAWRRRWSGGAGERRGAASYYGRPVLKAPVWTSEIPVYFFVGGLAGAAAPLALRRRAARATTRWRGAAWLVALAGVGGRARSLLIADLGRPERFHNMLRVFKADLADERRLVGARPAFGTATAVAARHAMLGWLPRRAARRPGRPRRARARRSRPTRRRCIADTAVPVWHEARRELPFVFAAGAAASAGAALTLLTPAADAARAAAGGRGAAAELGAAATSWSAASAPLGEPYREGDAGRFGKRREGADRRAARSAMAAAPGARRAAAAPAAALCRRRARALVGLPGRLPVGRGPEVRRWAAARARRGPR